MKTPFLHPIADGRSRPLRFSLIGAVALALLATTTGDHLASAADDTTAGPAPAPQFWSDVLSVGDCIVRPDDGTLPEPLSCDELHGEEIYAIGRLDLGPDAPYPGEAIADLVGEQLCEAATLEFGGETWDALPFTTFWLYPLEAEWEAGDRGIMCSAGPPEGIAMKMGSAAGGGLDSDDVLLARGGFSTPELGDFAEWVTVEEGATTSSVGTVSDGRFDLPLRRAWLVPQGFMFNATARGDDEYVTTLWGYTWATGEFTDLGSILPGWELASTMVMNGVSVFAGRETPDDDWDLFRAAKGEVEAIADGPGDQHFPTFTPDGNHVVFDDAGTLTVVDVDGSNERVLVGRSSNAYESAVSPDGRLVAFASDHAGNDDIWVVAFEGGEPVNLSQHPANEAWPAWSADGSRIYFQTDRLRPQNRVGSLMVMNADGSEASWISGAALGQPLPLDLASVGDALGTLPTIDERYLYEVVEGEPGTTTSWEHSSGQLAIELPAGWRVGESDEGIGFIAAPSPHLYAQLWEADGLAVTRYDDRSADDFFALFETTAASEFCTRIDGTAGLQPIDEVIDGMSATFECGDAGAAVGVIAMYNEQTGVGVVIEGQRDNVPDAESDNELLTTIARSLVWD